MAWTKPTVAEFKTFFLRDFNFAPEGSSDINLYILDSDITKAQNTALVNFNSGMFDSDENTTIAFQYLTAFYLVLSLQTSAQGVGSQVNFPVSSKSVGGVSISFTIPERILKNPVFSIFAQNGYGLTYLQLCLPYTIGNVHLIEGTTTNC